MNRYLQAPISYFKKYLFKSFIEPFHFESNLRDKEKDDAFNEEKKLGKVFHRRESLLK